MRKKRLKKDFPKRHKAILALRKMENTTREIITKSGSSILLNLDKRFTLQKPYKNQEYTKEMLRHLNKPIEATKNEKDKKD